MIADAGRELVQSCPFAGAVDTRAVIDPKQGDMVGAQNIFLFSIEKVPRFKIERQAAVGTSVFKYAYGGTVANNHQANCLILMVYLKAAGARIWNVIKGTKPMGYHGFCHGLALTA